MLLGASFPQNTPRHNERWYGVPQGAFVPRGLVVGALSYAPSFTSSRAPFFFRRHVFRRSLHLEPWARILELSRFDNTKHASLTNRPESLAHLTLAETEVPTEHGSVYDAWLTTARHRM